MSNTMTEQEMLHRMSVCMNACRGIETTVLEGHPLGVISATHSQLLHDAEKQLVAAIEYAGFSVSGPTDVRAAESGEPAWVCNARATIAEIGRSKHE